MNEKFEIRATYERIAYPKSSDPEAVTYHDQSLWVTGIGALPQGSDFYLQIEVRGNQTPYRISIPEDFKRLGYFIWMATDLPGIEIKYESIVLVSIVEKNGDKILAQTDLKFHTKERQG